MMPTSGTTVTAIPLNYASGGARRRWRWALWLLIAVLVAGGTHYVRQVLAERQVNARREKTIVVRALVGQARQLIYDGSYRKALTVIDTILLFDPQNDYAMGVRQFVADYADLKDRRKRRVGEPNWPVVQEVTATASRFDNVRLSEVLDFARDAWGVEVRVDWDAMKEFEVGPSMLVRFHTDAPMPFSAWLSKLLNEVSGGRLILDETSIRVSRAVVNIDRDIVPAPPAQPAQ